jgi:phosphoglycerol transferase MdoB-like AlkP superfamily enzyme
MLLRVLTFKKIKTLKNLFFAFYFTTTTYIPYKSLEKYTEDGTERTAYLNILYYSNYVLGKFSLKINNEDLFNKSIFIMCTDHQAYDVGEVMDFWRKQKSIKL